MADNTSHPSLFDINVMLPSKPIEDKILACNSTTEAYGLTLTQKQALKLVQTRTEVLKKTSRVEFGTGIIDKLILAFCDSPYIEQQNYEDTLHELISLFYSAKNDTWDTISDDALIEFMKDSFNGPCRGSLELLSTDALLPLARHIHSGYSFETFTYDSEQYDTEQNDE